MSSIKIDKIERIIKEIREKEQERLELEEELKKKDLALRTAQNKATTTLSALNDLQNRFDAKVEIEVINFSTDYYELCNTINTLKEKEDEIVEELKLLQKLKESYSNVSREMPERAFENGTKSVALYNQIHTLLSKQEVYYDLITNLTSEANKMKALILTELDEVKFLEENPGLKKMSENIEITHKIFVESISQVEELEKEIENISEKINNINREILTKETIFENTARRDEQVEEDQAWDEEA